MKRAWLSVDFNELVDDGVVMLSQTDTRTDSQGSTVRLREGLPVAVYEEDVYPDGTADFLVAWGVVTRYGQAACPFCPRVKWFCRFAPESFRNCPEWREEFHRQGFVILTERPGGPAAVSAAKWPKLPGVPKKLKKV